MLRAIVASAGIYSHPFGRHPRGKRYGYSAYRRDGPVHFNGVIRCNGGTTHQIQVTDTARGSACAKFRTSSHATRTCENRSASEPWMVDDKEDTICEQVLQKITPRQFIGEKDAPVPIIQRIGYDTGRDRRVQRCTQEYNAGNTPIERGGPVSAGASQRDESRIDTGNAIINEKDRSATVSISRRESRSQKTGRNTECECRIQWCAQSDSTENAPIEKGESVSASVLQRRNGSRGGTENAIIEKDRSVTASILRKKPDHMVLSTVIRMVTSASITYGIPFDPDYPVRICRPILEPRIEPSIEKCCNSQTQIGDWIPHEVHRPRDVDKEISGWTLE